MSVYFGTFCVTVSLLCLCFCASVCFKKLFKSTSTYVRILKQKKHTEENNDNNNNNNKG